VGSPAVRCAAATPRTSLGQRRYPTAPARQRQHERWPLQQRRRRTAAHRRSRAPHHRPSARVTPLPAQHPPAALPFSTTDPHLDAPASAAPPPSCLPLCVLTREWDQVGGALFAPDLVPRPTRLPFPQVGGGAAEAQDLSGSPVGSPEPGGPHGGPCAVAELTGRLSRAGSTTSADAPDAYSSALGRTTRHHPVPARLPAFAGNLLARAPSTILMGPLHSV